jgi:hypothetical protein
MSNLTQPGDASEAAEIREAQLAHDAGLEPTTEEEQLADGGASDPDAARQQAQVADNHKDMADKGADSQAEGKIE